MWDFRHNWNLEMFLSHVSGPHVIADDLISPSYITDSKSIQANSMSHWIQLLDQIPM